MVQSRLRGEWQGSRSRHHHYPISSARGEARGVCQWIAGHSSSATSTPMIRVACSADICVWCVPCVLYYYSSTTAVSGLIPRLLPPMTMLKTKPGCHFRKGVSSENGPAFSSGGHLENDIRKWKPEEISVSSLQYRQTGFATRKRSFSDVEPVL